MLDNETRKKIKALRNILVGKVPDPKSQVEQIMIGMIYKFMNDMDTQSITFGGNASFFVGEFEKYSWKKLRSKKVSGSDLVELYSSAVESMENNPHIPILFRNIFKNAFIPYKDPETLRLFLNQINEFDYSKDSEQLGDAFENILSLLSSQGDAGQFRTPRHVIDLVVQIINPKKDESILDPAAGTAGFLISAFKHIETSNTENKLGDLLKPRERKSIMQNINGYDISPDYIRIGLANMYLHGFLEPKLKEYDTLSSDEYWNEYYDVILANPPFMTPTQGIRPHNKFGIKSSKAEVLFIDYIISHLKPNGRAGIIVPDNILFDKKNKSIREKLLKNNLLWGIVSLPRGVFNPYTDAKTSILFIDKKNTSKVKKIKYFEILNDGYDLGTTRKPIKSNDLPKCLDYFINNKNDLFSFDYKEVLENKHLLLTQGQYQIKEENNIQKIQLNDLLDRNKTSIDIQDNEIYKRVTIKLYGKGIEKRDTEVGQNIGTKKQFLIKEGQLLLSKIDARNGAFGIVPKELDGAIITGNFWAFDIKDNLQISKDYLKSYLTSLKFSKLCEISSTGTTNRSYLNEDLFLEQYIPIPSKKVQIKISNLINNIYEYENNLKLNQEELNKIIQNL